jgi:hypothetical protein
MFKSYDWLVRYPQLFPKGNRLGVPVSRFTNVGTIGTVEYGRTMISLMVGQLLLAERIRHPRVFIPPVIGNCETRRLKWCRDYLNSLGHPFEYRNGHECVYSYPYNHDLVK